MNVMFQQSAIMWMWPRTTGDRTWVWYGLAETRLCPRLCLAGASVVHRELVEKVPSGFGE